MATAPGGRTGRTVRTGRKDRRPGFIADVDASGNRFNPNKLLFDPYALELSHDPLNLEQQRSTVFASGPNNRTLTAGPRRPKGIVLAIDASSIGTKPTRAHKDDIIYEVHVRGLTRKRSRHTGGSIVAPIAARRSRQAISRAWVSRRSNFFPCRRRRTTRTTRSPKSTQGVNYWGYIDAQLLRAGSPLCVRSLTGRPDARVQGDGQGVPRRRHEGVHRCGVQSHRREQ